MSSKRVSFRVEPAGERMLEHAAALEGVTVAEFCRTASEARAAVTIARHEPELVATWHALYPHIGPLLEALARGSARGT